MLIQKKKKQSMYLQHQFRSQRHINLKQTFLCFACTLVSLARLIEPERFRSQRLIYLKRTFLFFACTLVSPARLREPERSWKFIKKIESMGFNFKGQKIEGKKWEAEGA